MITTRGQKWLRSTGCCGKLETRSCGIRSSLLIPHDLVSSFPQYLEQWKNAQRKDSFSSFPQLMEGDGGVTWVRPQEFEIKLSFDAAIFSEFNTSGLRLVLVNQQEEWLWKKQYASRRFWILKWLKSWLLRKLLHGLSIRIANTLLLNQIA